MSKKFSQEFEYDDFDDAVDLVLSCDSDIDAAIERAAERADETGEDDLVTCMKENGDVPFDDDIEEMMYDEDEDDAIDIADIDAQDYREAYDLDEAMEDAEDQESLHSNLKLNTILSFHLPCKLTSFFIGSLL